MKSILILIIIAAISDPLAADSHRKSLSDCLELQETELDNGINLAINNSCDIKVSCHIDWSLTCAPGTKHKKRYNLTADLKIPSMESGSSSALADACGNDGWSIGGVAWSCKPE